MATWYSWLMRVYPARFARGGSASVCGVTWLLNHPTSRRRRLFRGSGCSVRSEKLGLTVSAKTRFLCMFSVFLRFFRAKKYPWGLSRVESLQFGTESTCLMYPVLICTKLMPPKDLHALNLCVKKYEPNSVYPVSSPVSLKQSCISFFELLTL